MIAHSKTRLSQAEKEAEEKQRLEEEQRREEARPLQSLLTSLCLSVSRGDSQERCRQEQEHREAEEIVRMAAEEQLQRERVLAEEARKRMEEGCRRGQTLRVPRPICVFCEVLFAPLMHCTLGLSRSS